jgi:hypothetical protein
MTPPECPVVRRTAVLSIVLALALTAGASAQTPGTYSGPVHCTGEDRYAPGGRVVRFESDPTATAVYGPSGALTRWTYVFLGRPDLVIQSRAVQRGQRFAYTAGKHIHHPGKTVVTVLAATATTVNAKLDWESNAGDYVGSGTFGLRLTPTSSGGIDYQAIKSVVKVPAGAKPDRSHPVVRRSELCSGPLSP